MRDPRYVRPMDRHLPEEGTIHHNNLFLGYELQGKGENSTVILLSKAGGVVTVLDTLSRPEDLRGLIKLLQHRTLDAGVWLFLAQARLAATP